MITAFTKRIFVASLVFSLFATKCFSQSTSFPFQLEHITTQQGLSNNDILRMLQDKNGFMWFVTDYGIDRFDGIEFKIFAYDPAAPVAISNWINDMKQDSSGIIWFASQGEGIYSFDPATGNTIHYSHEKGNENSLSENNASRIAIAKDGTVWIGTQDGLNSLDQRTKTFNHFFHHERDSTSLINNNVMSLCMDDDENLWLVTAAGGVDYFNTQTGKVMKHFSLGSTAKPLSEWNSFVYGVSSGMNGNIWIGSKESGLFCFNTKSKQTTHFWHDEKNPFSLSNNSVIMVCEDHAGNLWLLTEAQGLDYFDHRTGKFFHFTNDDLNLSVENFVTQIMEDSSHNIWIGTDDGAYLVNPQPNPFHSFQHDSKNKSSIAGNYANSFLRDHNGIFYVGSLGVDSFDAATNRFSHLRIEETGKGIIDENAVWNIYQDSKGTLWFATEIGLVSYDPKTKKHVWYRHDEHDSTSLSAESCTGIIEDRKGRYWVTTDLGGFDAFDPATKKFHAFKVHDGANSISTNSVGGLFEASDGMIYMGAVGGGLIIFNPDNETFKVYRHNGNDPSAISCDVTAGNFVETKSGIVWVATINGGIDAFDPRTGKFNAFTTKDGLGNNAVVSIVQDNRGNIWAGTYGGISCFTPPENPFDPSTFSKVQDSGKSHSLFRNYNTSDGLPSNEMNFLAAFKDADGKIYFGTTTTGIFYFNPDDLRDNEYVPPVYITEMKLYNNPVAVNDSTHLLSTSIENTKEIKLSYRQNMISFSFAALNFLHAEKNQYAYKLDGVNKDWIYTNSKNRTASYTNLAPGEYTFLVKGSNNDGVWNETPASMHLIIAAPFWQTGWFRILAVVSVALLLYGIYYYRMNQLRRLQTIRNNIASDLHDDIGSTLNSISILSEVAKQQIHQPIAALDQVGEASRRIIESMSDIVWTISPENDNFEKVIVRMRSFAYQMMKGKKIEFDFDADETLHKISLQMQQRKNFYLIFKEATTNIAKYSQAARAIFIIRLENHQVSMTIRDNGVGFNMNKIPLGNGIKNMRRRAEEIKAEIRIESSIKNGTSVEVKLKT